MAEAITYADLRFVKAPLKNNVSSQLGQDSEAYEDGELTYENVQVSSAPVVPSAPVMSSGLPSSGLGDKARLKAEQPTTNWSPVTSPAALRILRCPMVCLQYFLLGLLLTCLLLGVPTICLGVRYLQVSQQLQQVTRVLEATNNSLRQQLRLKITQLGQKEEDLLGSRRELAQIQETLQEEQRTLQDAKGQLQTCQSEGEKTRETLRREEEQRRNLDQRLTNMWNTLKGYFTCPSPGTCCPLGWILYQQSCFYVSPTEKSWEESEKHCSSLSAKLATFSATSGYFYLSPQEELFSFLNGIKYDSFWINQQKSYKPQHSRYSQCNKVQKTKWQWLQKSGCTDLYPFICQLDVFTFPDVDHSLP